MDQVVIDYLNPDIPAGLQTSSTCRWCAPTDESLKGYGEIVRDPYKHRIEIVPWPLGRLAPARCRHRHRGRHDRRHLRLRMARQRASWAATRRWAVTMSSAFASCRRRRNVPAWRWARAAFSCGIATTIPTAASSSGQIDGQPFVVPVAKAGDDLKPETFVAFWSDGSFGIYIHPGIWHEGVFPVDADRPLLRQAGQGACARELRSRPRVRRAAERSASARDLGAWRRTASEPRCRASRTPGC